MNQQSEAEKKRLTTSSSGEEKPPEEARALGGADSVDPVKKGCNPPETRLIDRLLNKDNLNEAFFKVLRNKGTGGVDGMQVGDLMKYLRDNWGHIERRLRHGKTSLRL